MQRLSGSPSNTANRIYPDWPPRPRAKKISPLKSIKFSGKRSDPRRSSVIRPLALTWQGRPKSLTDATVVESNMTVRDLLTKLRSEDPTAEIDVIQFRDLLPLGNNTVYLMLDRCE